MYTPVHILGGRRRSLPLVALALAVVLAAIVVLLSVGMEKPAKAAFPGANGKIAFESTQAGSEEIYVMNADGTGQIRLTNNPADDSRPSWGSPAPVYNFGGFYQPVDNLPTLNKTKPGKTIPVRFSLGGDRGLSIFELGYPKSEAIACDSTAPVDGVEETVTGKNGLTYDPVSNRYTYDWATNSSWSGCRQLVMKFSDGSTQRANFIFR